MTSRQSLSPMAVNILMLAVKGAGVSTPASSTLTDATQEAPQSRFQKKMDTQALRWKGP